MTVLVSDTKIGQRRDIIDLPSHTLAFLVLAYTHEVPSLRYMEFIRRLERSTGFVHVNNLTFRTDLASPFGVSRPQYQETRVRAH
jgi:hypothetical protein